MLEGEYHRLRIFALDLETFRPADCFFVALGRIRLFRMAIEGAREVIPPRLDENGGIRLSPVLE